MDGVLAILPTLISRGLFTQTVRSLDLFDVDYFEHRLEALVAAFPEAFCLHTLALKANPIRGVVQRACHSGQIGRAHV